MINVHIDFETRSEAELKTVGAYSYAEHYTTDIICICYAEGDMPVQTIPLLQIPDTPLLDDLRRLAERTDTIFTAHNAFFEQCIYKYVMVERFNFPELPPYRWRCTRAKAAAYGLPKSLENVANALELAHRKDTDGKRIMLRMSKPRTPTNNNPAKWHEDSDDFEKLYEYCVADVETERAVDDTLPDLTPAEQKIWEADQVMNMRGVPVDLQLAKKAMAISHEYSEVLTQELRSITDGVVNSCTRRTAFLNWLSVYGVNLPDFTAPTVQKALSSQGLPPQVRRALEIKLLLSKTSVSKYKAFQEMTSADGRLHGAFDYHSASTGRWGSRGVQLQNLARPDGVVDTDVAAESVLTLPLAPLTVIYPDVMRTLSYCTRSVIKAQDGEEFYVADYSSIEARGLAWLAGQTDKLQLFENGECAYCHAASKIFNKKINKKDNSYERQIGKVSELSLGYGGGINAYASMLQMFNLDIEPLFEEMWATATPNERQNAGFAYERYSKAAKEPLSERAGKVADIIKQRWRKANPMIVRFWTTQEESAISAVLHEGVIVQADGIAYQMKGDWLYCTLPSGRKLTYHHPVIRVANTERGEKKQQLQHMTLKSQTGKYDKAHTYGGKLAENITQAICRDILAEAMLRVEESGKYKVIMTVHDELVTTASEGSGSVQELCNIMSVQPQWAKGFPISAEGYSAKRYRK